MLAHKLRKPAAFLLCAALLLAAVAPLAFLAGHTAHDCAGDHCTLCLRLEDAQAGLRLLRTGRAATAASVGPGLLPAGDMPCFAAAPDTGSPVCLRVRLNN